MDIRGNPVISGSASGKVVFTDEPLSFWGGIDPETGTVIDKHHPLHGQSVKGAVLCMPTSRGSCTGSSVALQLLLGGHAPAAFVFGDKEEIVTLGVIIAEKMFGISAPVVRLSRDEFSALRMAKSAVVRDGHISSADDTGQGDVAVDASVDPISPDSASHVPDALELEETDLAMLRGDHGEAARFAMQVIVRMAGLYGAARLIDVAKVHIDGCIHTGDASVQFAERLRDLGAVTKAYTTLNSISVDRRNWRAQGVDPSVGEPSSRIADAYLAMGAQPTFTCAPYLLDTRPAPGEQIAWAESNAVVYANSILGARTMKYPDYLDICIALTGRAPLAGSHTDAGRRPELTIEIDRIDGHDDTLFPLLGYHVGRLAGNRIPLILGLDRLRPNDDDLKAFAGAFGTTSGAPMFQAVGITPDDGAQLEAPSRTGGPEGLRILRDDLADTWQRLNGGAGEVGIDHISLGSPHFSLPEIERLALLCRGLKKSPDVRVVVTCGRDVHARAMAAGLVESLRDFGVEFVLDTCWCMIGAPIIAPSEAGLLTNSGKYAHYGPGLAGRRVFLGSLAQCVETARSGKFDTGRPSWLADRG